MGERPVPRRVVGQAPHVRIVDAHDLETLASELLRPRLIRELPARQIATQVAAERRSASGAAAWALDATAVQAGGSLRGMPDAGEIRLAVRQSRRRSRQ